MGRYQPVSDLPGKTMKQQHADWIAANVKETLGRCAEATLAMAAAFPELTRVRGHYLCWVWGVAQVGRSVQLVGRGVEVRLVAPAGNGDLGKLVDVEIENSFGIASRALCRGGGFLRIGSLLGEGGPSRQATEKNRDEVYPPTAPPRKTAFGIHGSSPAPVSVQYRQVALPKTLRLTSVP